MNLKLRYKPIKSDQSILLQQKVNASDYVSLQNSSNNFRFSASVAAFGMFLRKSNYLNGFTIKQILSLSEGSIDKTDEYQTEFITLINAAKDIIK